MYRSLGWIKRNIKYTKYKVYKVRVITIVINRGGASVSQLLINRERVFKRKYYMISEYKIVNKNLLFTDFSIWSSDKEFPTF
jgi:hypothetical protein